MYDEEESEQENEEECNGNCEHCHAYKDNDLIEARCENFSGVMNTVHLLNRYDVDGDLYEENGEYSIIFSATGTKLKSLVIESCEFMINIERVDSIRMAHLEESKKLLLSNCAATLLKAENKVNNR
jgi:hypothetical protein